MNDQSSRSHLIFSIVIKTKNNSSGEVTKSKISFVDLAGSEKQSKSNPNTNIDRLKESNAINLSLKTLGDVI
jgi:kinesin family protein C1